MTNGILLVAGVQLFYAMSGAGAPIVYIHGNTGSSRWFSRVMDVPGFRTYALDMPNFGRSQPMPGEVDLHRYADYVHGFIEELGLEAPVVVGHSLGGAVAQSLALRNPANVGMLVLIDSAAPKGLQTPKERYPLIEMMRKDKSFVAKALAPTAPTLADPAFFESLVDDAFAMNEKAWIGNAEALSNFDVSADTHRFDKPVLVIWGRKDFIVTEAMARDTAAAYSRSELVILEEVGHSVIVEDPARFLSILTSFITR